jgi:mannose/fructose-specific phosphotransferase system component IIA
MTPEDYDLRLAAAVGPGRALVLCDLWGGTPHNRAQLLAGKSGRVICLAGVNLDMVLEAVLAAGELNAALVARVAEAGRRGIVESGHRATPSVRP